MSNYLYEEGAEVSLAMSFEDIDITNVDALATLADIIADPIKRITTLYKIRNKKGKEIQFVPNPEQMEVLIELFVKGNTKILIIKARQLGMSTLIDVIICDHLVFNAGAQCSIVDRKLLDAALKLRGKVRDTFMSLPSIIRGTFEIVRNHDSEFSIRRVAVGCDPDPASSCFAGTNARGGTNQILHISEWGPIQFSDPKRSKEILTGALPSATEGMILNETTWMGGKKGDLWKITERSIYVRANPQFKTADDFTLLFFPWWGAAEYQTEGDMTQVTPDVWAYFAELQQHPDVIAAKHVFRPQQILWYFVVAMSKGDERYREYPSVLEEAFKAPIPGAIWQKHVERARMEGRICNLPHDETSLVYTFWDLGAPLNTRVVYLQFVNGMLNIIDHDTGLDLLPAARVAHMNKKGYSYGGHFFPHDGKRLEYSGISFSQQMAAAGLVGIKLIPRTREIWTGINEISGLFSRIQIDKDKCVDLIESMSCYHTALEDDDPEKPTSNVVHDESSHDCDAVRYIAEALHANLVHIGMNYKHAIADHQIQSELEKASRGHHGHPKTGGNWWNNRGGGGAPDGRAQTGNYRLRR